MFYVSVLITFTIIVIKCSDKTTLRKEGFILAHGSRVQSIMVAKLCEAAAQVAFKKQKNAAAQLTASFLCSAGPQAREWQHPIQGQGGGCLFTFINLMEIVSHRHA